MNLSLPSPGSPNSVPTTSPRGNIKEWFQYCVVQSQSQIFLSLININHNPLPVPAPHPSPGKSPEVGPDSALSPAQDLTIFVMPPGKTGCGPHLDPAKVTYTRDICIWNCSIEWEHRYNELMTPGCAPARGVRPWSPAPRPAGVRAAAGGRGAGSEEDVRAAEA